MTSTFPLAHTDQGVPAARHRGQRSRLTGTAEGQSGIGPTMHFSFNAIDDSLSEGRAGRDAEDSPEADFMPAESHVHEPLAKARGRKPEGHISRPPNAFMLFRSDFNKKRAQAPVMDGGTSISKAAGLAWQSMPQEEKKPWCDLAEHVKAAHKARYPDYKFRPQKRGDAAQKGATGNAGRRRTMMGSKRAASAAGSINADERTAKRRKHATAGAPNARAQTSSNRASADEDTAEWPQDTFGGFFVAGSSEAQQMPPPSFFPGANVSNDRPARGRQTQYPVMPTTLFQSEHLMRTPTPAMSPSGPFSSVESSPALLMTPEHSFDFHPLSIDTCMTFEEEGYGQASPPTLQGGHDAMFDSLQSLIPGQPSIPEVAYDLPQDAMASREVHRSHSPDWRTSNQVYPLAPVGPLDDMSLVGSGCTSISKSARVRASHTEQVTGDTDLAFSQALFGSLGVDGA